MSLSVHQFSVWILFPVKVAVFLSIVNRRLLPSALFGLLLKNEINTRL